MERGIERDGRPVHKRRVVYRFFFMGKRQPGNVITCGAKNDTNKRHLWEEVSFVVPRGYLSV